MAVITYYQDAPPDAATLALIASRGDTVQYIPRPTPPVDAGGNILPISNYVPGLLVQLPGYPTPVDPFQVANNPNANPTLRALAAASLPPQFRVSVPTAVIGIMDLPGLPGPSAGVSAPPGVAGVPPSGPLPGTGTVPQATRSAQTAPSGAMPATTRAGTTTGAPPGGGAQPGGQVPVEGGVAGQQLQSIRTMAQAESGQQDPSFTADQWCFWFARVTGSPCPAPEDFGFTGDARFQPVPFLTWWQRLSGSGLVVAGNNGLIPALGTAPAPGAPGKEPQGKPPAGVPDVAKILVWGVIGLALFAALRG
jgi:hypothetical protein